MARGEALVTCPECGAQSRIPVIALQHNNYHCSSCGNRIPLASVTMSDDSGNRPPVRPRNKRPFNKRKRR
jgi:DNA-directed RNA polymerase subunit RPC12/RpoP